MTRAMALDAPIIDRPATYQDVLDAPPNMVAEIVNGTLHTQPRPAMPHVYAGSRLGGRLDRYFHDDDDGGPGGWWILDEPELHLGDNVIVPDLAGWRRERMPEYPDSAYCTVTPDWVCEILSPSTKKFDRFEKRAVYAAEGVGHLWFIDPIARGLEAFELQDGQWLLIAMLQDAAEVRVAPFDAIAFPLDALWP